SWLAIRVVPAKNREHRHCHKVELPESLRHRGGVTEVDKRIGHVLIICSKLWVTCVSAQWVGESRGCACAGICSLNANHRSIILKTHTVSGGVVKDVSAFRIIFRLKVLVNQQTAP